MVSDQKIRTVNAQEMREIDAFTINSMGMPSMVLMERAALACVTRLEKGDFDLTSTLALCGTGNNGGDGIAIARLLRLSGRKAYIVVVGDRDSLGANAAQQLAIAKNYGVPVTCYSPGCLKDAKTATIVDALFGVGLSRPVKGIYREVLAEAKELVASGTGILAVDVPSGISADTGEILGEALPARATVTFTYNKTGLTRDPGKTIAGDLTVADIGIYDIDTLRRASELLSDQREEDIGRSVDSSTP
jgi:NAD(P)H-hydrate epimerase